MLFLYNHQNKNEAFMLSISVPYSKVKLGLKLGEQDYIYEKVIVNNYYLNMKSDEILDKSLRC